MKNCSSVLHKFLLMSQVLSSSGTNKVLHRLVHASWCSPTGRLWYLSLFLYCRRFPSGFQSCLASKIKQEQMHHPGVNLTELIQKDSDLLGKPSFVFLLAMQISHEICASWGFSVNFFHSTIKTSSVRNRKGSIIQLWKKKEMRDSCYRMEMFLFFFVLVFYSFNRLIYSQI